MEEKTILDYYGREFLTKVAEELTHHRSLRDACTQHGWDYSHVYARLRSYGKRIRYGRIVPALS